MKLIKIDLGKRTEELMAMDVTKENALILANAANDFMVIRPEFNETCVIVMPEDYNIETDGLFRHEETPDSKAQERFAVTIKRVLNNYYGIHPTKIEKKNSKYGEFKKDKK